MATTVPLTWQQMMSGLGSAYGYTAPTTKKKRRKTTAEVARDRIAELEAQLAGLAKAGEEGRYAPLQTAAPPTAAPRPSPYYFGTRHVSGGGPGGIPMTPGMSITSQTTSGLTGAPTGPMTTTPLTTGGGVGGMTEQQAMIETQRRAAADRARALGGFSGTEELLRGAMAEPESISDEVQAQMVARGRTGIEAATQARKRAIQESYGRRGIPGGAMRGEMAQAGEAGMGTIANLERDIGIERATRKRQELLQLAGMGAQVGGTMAQIYGQTIAAVPGETPGEDEEALRAEYEQWNASRPVNFRIGYEQWKKLYSGRA